MKTFGATGLLQVGAGRALPIFQLTVQDARMDGDTDILLSADGRHVWLTLDRDSALRLAAALNEHAKYSEGA